MTLSTPRRVLHELAERDIPESFDAWPAIQARVGACSKRPQPRNLALRWGLAAASVALLALSGATLVVTSGPQLVSAEALLDQAGAISDGAAQSLRSYHITATTTLRPSDPQRSSMVQHEETWFGGTGRMRQETDSPDWSSVTVTNGQDAWWAITRGGHTYAAPARGIRFSDTAHLNPLAPEGSNIASVLMFAQHRGCGTFQLQPEQRVAGRAAYVVSVTRTLKEDCGPGLGSLAEPSPSPKLDAAPQAAAMQRADDKKAPVATQESSRPQKTPGGPTSQPSPMPLAVITKPADAVDKADALRVANQAVVDTFWIDRETFVPLKAVENVGPKGTSNYEVTSVEFNVDLPDATFQFSPPAGAQVLSDPGEMKKVLASR